MTVFLFFFQVFTIFLLLDIPSMVNLHPNYHVIINEAAPNNDGESFVELYVTVIDPNDEYSGEDKPKIGLIILEPVQTTSGKREAKIVGTIDLTDLIEWGKKFYYKFPHIMGRSNKKKKLGVINKKLKF